jgi:3-oxoacyl-[acyl-carrier protein] reductase
MSKLNGKVAVVSGSGRGIGRAIALKLAVEGAKVVVNDLDDAPAQAVVDEIRAFGSSAIACCGDVTAPEFGERFVQSAIENFGGLDIIVNNAGYTWDNVIQKTNDEQFVAMLDVHVKAPFNILRAAANPIRALAKQEAQQGHKVHRKVINISSIAGLYGNAGQVGYASAKAAMVGMTRTLAKEWGRYLVNVNCVAFGWIETRLTQAISADHPATVNVAGNAINVGIQPHLLQTFESLIPLGRAGTPEEAAGAIYLLCIPESDYISGQVLVAGGGLIV